MTCEEFERVLPEESRSEDQESHLASCVNCSDLVADLDAICRQARLLRDVDEPSPIVWNSIELALRREGLIREPNAQPFLVPARPRRWRLGWLAPAAITIALIFGMVQHERERNQPDRVAQTGVTVISQLGDSRSADDQQLLEAVSRRSPAMLASYQANLRDVNSYIRDA